MANPFVPAVNTASTVPWFQKPVLPLRVASEVLGVSRSSLYRLQASGKLTFSRIGGKTVVRTSSVTAYLEAIEDWSSTGASGAKAVRS
jgi:excisionase family DNA binding protein